MTSPRKRRPHGKPRSVGRRVRNQAGCRSSSGLSSGSESRDRIECPTLRRRCRSVGPRAGRPELPLYVSHGERVSGCHRDAPTMKWRRCRWRDGRGAIIRAWWFVGRHARSLLHFAQRDPGVEGGGDESAAQHVGPGTLHAALETDGRRQHESQHHGIPRREPRSGMAHNDPTRAKKIGQIRDRFNSGETCSPERSSLIKGYQLLNPRHPAAGSVPPPARRSARNRRSSRERHGSARASTHPA
jgi:hypothetical protein